MEYCKIRNREPVKVVIIATQFIEANPMSFKSVVQSLTGKDSCVSWVEESSYKSRKRSRSAEKSSGGGDTADMAAAAAVKFSRYQSSFQDWDGLMLELPPPEEMRWVWGD